MQHFKVKEILYGREYRSHRRVEFAGSILHHSPASAYGARLCRARRFDRRRTC